MLKRFLILLVLLGLLTACGGAPKADIIGHWRDPGTGAELKFLSNGYALAAGTVTKYDLSADGMLLSLFSSTSPVEVGADTLTVGTDTTYKRVSSEIILTALEERAITQIKLQAVNEGWQ